MVQEKLLGNEDREVGDTVEFVNHFRAFVLLSTCWEYSRKFEQKGSKTWLSF